MDINSVESKLQSQQPEEGRITSMVEKATAQIPSIGFLSLAGASILLSLGFKLSKKDDIANFVGLWTPTILLIGIYNKLVKVQGSDRRDQMLH